LSRTAASSSRERRRLDPGADCSAGFRQRADVVGIEPGQAVGDAAGETVGGEEGPKGVGRGGETAGHANPGVGQLADHFAEGGVLSADRLDVGHPQFIERYDQGGRQVVG
jgi:hypothetical protein